MEFIAISFLVFLIVAFQSKSHKREMKLANIPHEPSHYSNIDELLELNIISRYEHEELITRLKEKNI